MLEKKESESNNNKNDIAAEMVYMQLALRLASLEQILIKKNIVSLKEIEEAQEEVLKDWNQVINQNA